MVCLLNKIFVLFHINKSLTKSLSFKKNLIEKDYKRLSSVFSYCFASGGFAPLGGKAARPTFNAFAT
jgi:hypothetical protein